MNKKPKQMENKSMLIWKIAVASAISWEVAKLAGSDHPYLAPLSVILCLQTTVNRSIQYSYHRMVGTVIGIVVTMVAAPYIGVNGWMIGGLILIGGFITKWLKRDESAIHQVALTVLLVFVMEHKSGDYFIDRFRDTLIGAIAAILLHILFYPPQKRLNILTFGYTYLATMMETLINWANEGTITSFQQTQWADQIKELIPIFSDREKPAGIPGEIIKIEIPLEFQKQQYLVSLFNQTTQLVNQISDFTRAGAKESGL